MQRAATRLGLQGYSFVSKISAVSRDSKQLLIEDHVYESLALFGAVSELLQTFYLPLEQLFLQHSITTVCTSSAYYICTSLTCSIFADVD